MYICIYRFWPTYLAEPVRPPPEVARAMKIFVNFYTDTGRHSNRKLHWVHSLSSMVITGLFEEKRVDLQVRQSTFEFQFQIQIQIKHICEFNAGRGMFGSNVYHHFPRVFHFPRVCTCVPCR